MITRLSQVTWSPLCWPETKSRCSDRQKSKFSGTTQPKSQREIEEEINRWFPKIDHYILSMEPLHRGTTGDPGVALWWTGLAEPGREPELRVLACDTFLSRADNMHAIAITLHDLRRIERYGTYTTDQAAEGMKALPPPPSAAPAPQVRTWWDILGCSLDWPLDAIEMAYRTKAAKAHPDAGGSGDEMAEINGAIEEARKEKQG